jgi:excisionase family DNA binding protein
MAAYGCPLTRITAMDKLLYSVREAAALLSVSENFVWNLLRDRKLTGVKVGRSRRIPAAELQRYVDSLAFAAPS